MLPSWLRELSVVLARLVFIPKRKAGEYSTWLLPQSVSCWKVSRLRRKTLSPLILVLPTVWWIFVWISDTFMDTFDFGQVPKAICQLNGMLQNCVIRIEDNMGNRFQMKLCHCINCMTLAHSLARNVEIDTKLSIADRGAWKTIALSADVRSSHSWEQNLTALLHPIQDFNCQTHIEPDKYGYDILCALSVRMKQRKHHSNLKWRGLKAPFDHLGGWDVTNCAIRADIRAIHALVRLMGESALT